MPEPTIRPFADWLQDLSGGETLDTLGKQLHELIAAVQSTGLPGKLNLEVTIRPASGDGRTMQVGDKIKVTLPDPERGTSIFFVSHDGNLIRHNPDQMRLPLREVPDTVDPDTGELKDREVQA